MRELSLFTGAGGGLLGSHLLGWTPIGYVEINDYCQRVLAARIADGLIPEAPIFGDIRAFNRDGYAEAYQGMVDVLTAGFPCQPFSVAGARRGPDDPRNMWPATAESIRLVRPRWFLLENVPGLLAGHGYFGEILRELAEMGYHVRWGMLSAADTGAPHLRKRLWIVGAAPGAVSDPERHRLWEQWERDRKQRDQSRPSEPRDDGQAGSMAYSDGRGCSELREPEPGREQGPCRDIPGGRCSWWTVDPAEGGEEAQPRMGRVAHGVASRVDRLRALGNGQVPAVVALAWEMLASSPPSRTP